MQDLRSAFWLYVVENGINIVAAVALVGPLGVVRGIALSITIAYTVSAAVALAHVRTRVHGLDSELVLGPLGHVALATAALVVGAVETASGIEQGGSQTDEAVAGQLGHEQEEQLRRHPSVLGRLGRMVECRGGVDDERGEGQEHHRRRRAEMDLDPA